MEPEKKYSYLDEYRILRTLGSGYHAQVKLGADENGKMVAIKRYKKETANLGTLQHELNIMKELQHQNLVQLIDVRQNATYKRRDQSTYQCFAIVLEFVGGGELFDYVAETGKFSEKVARTYFHQMMNGLHYMHSKGYAHRDIKPENILLARDFALKLADFGFSCLLKGKDGQGTLHTKLGTQGYMAPEIPTKNYQGDKVDIFAAGVILFIMYAGNPPFEKAAPNDPYYRLLKEKNYNTFWKAHSRRRPVNYFSNEFKDLFVSMVAYNPQQRPSMQQIAGHAWVAQNVCSQAQIAEEFVNRQKKLDQIMDAKKMQQEQKRSQANKTTGTGIRGDGQTLFDEIYEEEADLDRELPQLMPLSADDFLIAENKFYAIALMKSFLKENKILIEEEVIGEESVYLTVSDVVEDNDGKMKISYEYGFEIEGEKFKEKVDLAVRFGNASNEKLAVCFNVEGGNRLYYKKIVKEMKGLYANCLA